MEVIGLADDVLLELKKLQSAQLCSNTVGQIVVDCITNPPKPGDESYDLYKKVGMPHHNTDSTAVGLGGGYSLPHDFIKPHVGS